MSGTKATGGNAGTLATGGNAGTLATGGGGNGGNAGNAGSAGSAGKSGAGGVAEAGPDGAKEAGPDGDACVGHNIIATAPTGLPSQVALTVTGATLIGGYRASGDQIYTCTAVADAGSDAEAGALTGTYVNTAEAVFFGNNCVKAGDHSYSNGSPMWKYVDGSSVTATRDDAVDPPGTDGGTPTAIKWVRLRATGNGGEGILSNVTWVQRIATTGGLPPGTSCDPSKAADAGGVVRVPYTADYFFYSGGTSSEAGSEAGSETGDDAGDDGSADSGG
jgi:hypothetical protein